MSGTPTQPPGNTERKNRDDSGQPANPDPSPQIPRISRTEFFLGLFRISPVEWVLVALLVAMAGGVGWPHYTKWRAVLSAREEMEGIAAIRTGIANWSALNSAQWYTRYPSILDTCRLTDDECRLFGLILSDVPPGDWGKKGVLIYENAAGRTFVYSPSTGQWTDTVKSETPTP